jgi:hypothetical protein
MIKFLHLCRQTPSGRVLKDLLQYARKQRHDSLLLPLGVVAIHIGAKDIGRTILSLEVVDDQ